MQKTSRRSPLYNPVGVKQRPDYDGDPDGPGVKIYDPDFPRSVVNIVYKPLREAILALDTRLRYLSESELERICEPDPVDRRLRLSFWDEYGLAQDQNRNMLVNRILRNICPLEYWDRRVLPNPEKLAYIVIPPRDYEIGMRANFEKAMDRLEEFLKLPVVDDEGKVNSNLIGKIVKIAEMLQLRLYGAVPQANINMNLNQAMEDTEKKPKSISDVEREIASLKKRMIEGVEVGDGREVVEEGIVVSEDGVVGVDDIKRMVENDGIVGREDS